MRRKKMPILKIDEIAPDGVKITLQWEKFVVGSSMFIPCIDVEEATKQVKRICKEKGFTITCKVVIYNDKFGLRITRTL